MNLRSYQIRYCIQPFLDQLNRALRSDPEITLKTRLVWIPAPYVKLAVPELVEHHERQANRAKQQVNRMQKADRHTKIYKINASPIKEVLDSDDSTDSGDSNCIIDLAEDDDSNKIDLTKDDNIIDLTREDSVSLEVYNGVLFTSNDDVVIDLTSDDE
jgi:hypothetical protein